MRNKQKDFPIRKQTNLNPRAKADNHALRPNGSINTTPQERMGRGEDNHVSS
ncbi:Small, acid-soluble spore protein K [Paraliobacillus sp. PM-2]|uniref:small acid-soluble spore protein K n=1 Tax=Paraliobacillus sp. PM-2 TaxID=1462524 RepID=UPI00061BB61A|nr:small acid-soluble spore protein K [Paraliobacillus sp. PM-2]CQR47212.1 Small, acid-soluble spore protein K [Paraliobacillus sp. PM-2]